jgi:zinc D-Ala-D-Ala carboxypeptidase
LANKERRLGFRQLLLILLAVFVSVLLVVNRAQRTASRVRLSALEQAAQSTESPEQTTLDMELPSERSDIQVTADILLGKADPASHDDFVQIDESFASRKGMYMRKEAYEAFVQMHAAAREDGIGLIILSAMRHFDHQKRIWENKWNGRQLLHGNIRATSIDNPVERAMEILRFSAMPGTSRHHWGTDIDLNSLQNSYFESGEGKKIYDWLQENAHAYGFCQPYTPLGQNRGGGYEEEKWHWSYIPIAAVYLRAFPQLIGYKHISGFDGSDLAGEIGVIERYVLQVDPSCE